MDIFLTNSCTSFQVNGKLQYNDIIAFKVRGWESLSVSDKSYYALTKEAYLKETQNVKIIIDGKIEAWEQIKIDKSLTNIKKSGFDAKVYVNHKTKNIVIAYRGTQGDDLTGEGLPDVVTDIDDVVMKGYKKNQDKLKRVEEVKKSNPDLYASTSHTFDIEMIRLKDKIKNSQFYQAEVLLKEVKKYQKQNLKNYEISTTGHSLGGALSEYVSASHNIKSVSYSAPSIVKLLPDDIQDDVKKGKFNKSIIAYVHPSDSIGAGAFVSDNHVGKTYYIDEPFESANIDKRNPLQRFIDSVGAPGYHYLPKYKFDVNGNIFNLLIDRDTKKIVFQSPNYHDGVEIELTPEVIRKIGVKIKHLAIECTEDVDSTIAAVGNIADNAKSNTHTATAKKLANQLCEDLYDHKKWILEAFTEVGEFIVKKADDFKKADEDIAATLKGK